MSEPQGNICGDCARLKGLKPIKDIFTNWIGWIGTCDFCHQTKGVSSVHDWRWPGNTIILASWDWEKED